MIDDIVKFYAIGDSMKQLEGPEQLKDVLDSLKD
jgi:hypothetical protein